MQEDELFESVKAKMDANKKSKLKSKLFVALTVFIMLAGTAAAGTLLQTVNAPHLGIQATTTGPISGSVAVTVLTAPTTLDFGDYELVEFQITNSYPSYVKVLGTGEWFTIENSSGAHPPYPYTPGVADIESYLLYNVTDIQIINTAKTSVLWQGTYSQFMTNGVQIPAGSTWILQIQVRMPTETLNVHDASMNNITYTMVTGDMLNIDAKFNVESI